MIERFRDHQYELVGHVEERGHGGYQTSQSMVAENVNGKRHEVYQDFMQLAERGGRRYTAVVAIWGTKAAEVGCEGARRRVHILTCISNL